MEMYLQAIDRGWTLANNRLISLKKILDFLHVITNIYTVLNQKVSFLLQFFEG